MDLHCLKTHRTNLSFSHQLLSTKTKVTLSNDSGINVEIGCPAAFDGYLFVSKL